MSDIRTAIVNGRVLTMDPAHPRAQAVLITGNRIAAVGTTVEIAALAGPEAEVIDARGRTVLPGFIESHVHLFVAAAELNHIQLWGLKGFDQMAAAIRDFAAAHPDAPMLVGQGVSYDMLGEPITRQALDRMLPDRPFILNGADHHTAWANTAALKAAGLLRGKTVTPGNEIVMGEDGLATGELREVEAISPIMALAGEERVTLGVHSGAEPETPPTEDEMAFDADILARGLEHVARFGITSMVNMDGNRYMLEVLARLRAEGRLTARVKVPFHYRSWRTLADLEQASEMSKDYNDEWLSCGFVKVFLDGVVESGTAAMVDDYPDRPGWKGELIFSPKDFAALVTESDRRGLQIAVHAIGDRAVRTVLDSVDAARAANGPRDSRHRIEHIEFLHPDDLPRLGASGIVASLQPCNAPGAMDFPPLDPDGNIAGLRWSHAYLLRSIAETGAAQCFSSDWPIADVNVLRGVQAAMTRPRYPGGPDDRLSLPEVLAGYTYGGAYATHNEDRKGRLAVGYLADVIVLSDDIETVSVDQIGTLSVTRTIVDGRTVWQA
ncbi:MAG: amidohydrolase [Paracoccaceae bacterium]